MIKIVSLIDVLSVVSMRRQQIRFLMMLVISRVMLLISLTLLLMRYLHTILLT